MIHPIHGEVSFRRFPFLCVGHAVLYIYQVSLVRELIEVKEVITPYGRLGS